MIPRCFVNWVPGGYNNKFKLLFNYPDY